MSSGVGCRRGSDLALLWLWRRLEARAPICPLAWEHPYTAGVALKRKKKKKKEILYHIGTLRAMGIEPAVWILARVMFSLKNQGFCFVLLCGCIQ